MSKNVLETNHLSKYFSVGNQSLFNRQVSQIRAVDGVDVWLKRGETLAVVGESGCGKSTLALLLMGLEEASGGDILINNQDIKTTNKKALRRKIQMIFQDPYESLNPTQTIEQIIAEPLEVHGLAKNATERREKVLRALEDTGLKPAESYINRFPHQLSGGQRQRVVIASALVLEPQILIADEPVSMLDVSIRAEIINLLFELRETRQISVLFITHDLGSVGHFADRLAVMYLGKIVETGPTKEVLDNPKHPYTQALISVIPVPNPRLRQKRVILQGETPNPSNIPSGCRFHPRCPVAEERCKTITPVFVDVTENHQAACLLV